MMKFAVLALLALPAYAQDAAIPGPVPFTQSVLVSDLQAPWEITWGPDDMLWLTERTAGRIDRINPATGEILPAYTLTDMVANSGQDGLLGLALDPGLGKGQDYVYTFYTYSDPKAPADPTVTDPASPFLHEYSRLIRLSYDATTGLLSNPLTLIEGLPAGSDHDSGRLKIGPDAKLYLTLGDQGNDQLANYCLPILAQRLPTAAELGAKDYFAYQGKSLRLNLDGSIPADNPTLNGVQSHVFTYGHRNMQGLAFGPDGTLYASEQGPKTDDEVNILTSGANYGWPHVAGFQDDKAYQYAQWPLSTKGCTSIAFSDITIDPSVPRADESAFTQPFTPPIATLFTVPTGWNFADPICNGMNFICWPTVAASSIETYMRPDNPIPGFGNALLVTALKRGSLYRVPLSPDGKTAVGPVERYFQTDNRYRDSTVSPDGKTIYILTDPGGLHQAVAGGVSDKVTNSGAILVYTYKAP